MAEEKQLSIDPEETLKAICRICMERLPDAVVTGEVTGVNENDIKLALVDKDGNLHTTKVRISLAKSETESWLNTIEQPS